MIKCKRIIKLIAFILLLALACVGIGLSGGVPVPFSGRRQQDPDVKIELVETKKKETKLKKATIK